jgi:prepilin-type N-terminal cleavage/methylation domain-containing protein
MLKTRIRRQVRDPHDAAQKAGEQRGFTLVETSIAMVIMMIAALASVSLFAYSIKFNSGASDRELAMAVAQQQMEQLRSVSFSDSSLAATTGTTSTVTNAGRQYTVFKKIADGNVVSGTATIKTITIQVTPVSTTLGAVSLRTQRSTLLKGPY